MSKVIAICTSVEKGTPKVKIEGANVIENFGIDGDAHGGNWHRQVSLLSLEKIEEFKNRGGKVKFGDFGENLVVSEINLIELPIGQRIRVGEDVILELTQIGKKCHDKCAIYYQVGQCIMPKNGVFTRVLSGGKIKTGDSVVLL